MLFQFLPLGICEDMTVLPPKPAQERACEWRWDGVCCFCSLMHRIPLGETCQKAATAHRVCENQALQTWKRKGGYKPACGTGHLKDSVSRPTCRGMATLSLYGYAPASETGEVTAKSATGSAIQPKVQVLFLSLAADQGHQRKRKSC